MKSISSKLFLFRFPSSILKGFSVRTFDDLLMLGIGGGADWML